MIRRALPCVLCVLTVGCGGGSNPAGPSDPPVPVVAYAAEVQLCVDQTNVYRATLGLRPYAHSAALDAVAKTAAAFDGGVHVGHAYFLQTNGGGIAMAENEIPWWPMSLVGNVRQVVLEGLAGMWEEGPSGGHYRHMAGSFQELGCGIFVNGQEVTVVQDFR